MWSSHFAKLWHYNDWANGRCIDLIAQHPDPASLRLFAHLVGTQNVWLVRLDRSFSTDWGLWDDRDPTHCRVGARSSTEAWVRFLSPLPDARFDRRVEYCDTAGNPWSHFLHDIVSNVLNHSAHHRGQIALRARQAGAVPPPLDYMVYLRQTE